MGWGDYARKRIIYQDASGNLTFAATDGTKTLIAAKTGYTIYVQRIIVSITTSAAQTITFQDNAGTPVVLNQIPANPGQYTRWDFDFGPEGYPLTDGKELDQAMTAGNAGNTEFLAYYKPDAVTTVVGNTADVGQVVHTFANAYPTDN